MVTGSHNPPEDNGFKMLIGKGTVHGDDIRALARAHRGAATSSARPAATSSAPRSDPATSRG